MCNSFCLVCLFPYGSVEVIQIGIRGKRQLNDGMSDVISCVLVSVICVSAESYIDHSFQLRALQW